MERSGSASRICCRGHESERILSLPVVERPEEEREGNLSEVGCAVKERGRPSSSWNGLSESGPRRHSIISSGWSRTDGRAARRDYALLFRMSPGAS